MPPVRQLTPGYTVVYPNRDKVMSKIAKAIVVLIILVSVALMLAVTIGGWSKLEGLTPINFAWCLVYLIMAAYIARWARGLLPIVAALGILLLIVALIAGFGVSGTSWFDRNHVDYAPAMSLFGGKGFSPNTLGVLTVILAPVQVLLIIVSMAAFAQGWNVEVEAPIKSLRHGGTPSDAAAAAAA